MRKNLPLLLMRMFIGGEIRKKRPAVVVSNDARVAWIPPLFIDSCCISDPNHRVYELVDIAAESARRGSGPLDT